MRQTGLTLLGNTEESSRSQNVQRRLIRARTILSGAIGHRTFPTQPHFQERFGDIPLIEAWSKFLPARWSRARDKLGFRLRIAR